MADAVTWELLRDLAGLRARRGRAVSIYVNLDPSAAPTAGDVATRVRSVVTQGERRLEAERNGLSHDQRLALKSDLERVATWLDDEFDRDGARGVAVFCSSLDDLWRAYALPEAVEDAIEVDEELYLAPLVRLVGEEPVVVAFVGRERGQVYRLRGRSLVEIANETEDVPNKHQQGGWSQARYERHVEEVVARHLRQVAETLDRCVRRLRHAVIVLVSTEETRAELEALLPSEAKSAIVGCAQAEAHAGPAELLAAVEPLLEERRVAREREELARWRELAAKGERATAGWQDTLAAASDGRVDALLIQVGVDRPAHRCPTCGRAEAQGGTCPLDGTPMVEEPHGLDLVVHQALAHGGSVVVIQSEPDLEPVEGIGAVLRF